MNYLGMAILLTGLIAVSLACGSDPATPDFGSVAGRDQETVGTLKISMADFKFTPDRIDLQACQQIRVVLTNESTTNDHSFTVGYGMMKEGKSLTGFKADLFGEIEVKVSGPAKLVRRGNTDLVLDGDIDDSPGSFMVVKAPSSQATTIEFTVPEVIGEFEYASFENNGKDYEDGMKGMIKVFPRSQETRGLSAARHLSCNQQKKW